jgi:hypothetical protein
MHAKELMSTKLVVAPPEMPFTAPAELLAARGISAVRASDMRAPRACARA